MLHQPRRICLARAGIVLVLLATPEVRAETPEEFFERSVRPVLVDRCLKCHGGGSVKGGLDLSTREGLIEGGLSGPAVTPGKPEESLLVEAVGHESFPAMPPKAKLPESEIASLTRWVEMGLPWPDSQPMRLKAASGEEFSEEERAWWAFQPVKDTEPPKVEDSAWPSVPLDRFILAKMEEAGVRPAPEADRRTWLRRVTFDLVGLPPSPEQVEAFLADDSPGAYGRVVDRLLASPQYGERWGRFWLDLARYADSRDARGIGGASDIGEAWRYRDWVVDAFNRDMPYDRFLKLQIAGDLVPGPGPDGFNAEGLVATGLLTIGEWGTGDADKEKMMTDIVDDQIDVLGRAVLGLTLACARCHDHKFDPIRQRDYYALAGIFFSTHIIPEPGAKTGGSPMLRTPVVPPSVVREAERQTARRKKLESAFQEKLKKANADYLRSRIARAEEGLRAAWALARGQAAERTPLSDAWTGLMRMKEDVSLLSRSASNVRGAEGVHGWNGDGGRASVTVNTTSRPVSMLTFTLPERSVSVHPGPGSSAVVTWRSPVSGRVRIEGGLTDADPKGGEGVAWELGHRRGPAYHVLACGTIANGGSQRFDQGAYQAPDREISVKPGDTLQLLVMPNAEYTCDTTTVALEILARDGQTWDLARDVLDDPLLMGRGNPHPDGSGRPGVWSFGDLPGAMRARPSEVLEVLGPWARAALEHDEDALGPAFGAIGKEAAREGSPLPEALLSARRNSPESEALGHLDEPVRSELEALKTERDRLRNNPPPEIPLALAAREGGVPKSRYEGIHDARILARGSYTRPGNLVPRDVPAILEREGEEFSIKSGSGRLELAEWVASERNPLTARVMANRIWQHHFGQGIVRTPSNFGKLGEPPTHPKLLDFLAARFVRSGWSVKALHRAVVLSATYRQSSRAPAETLRDDPENRLFSRADRRRLDSEALRDSLLSVAGRLDLSRGGPAYRDIRAPRRTLYLMTIRSDRSSYRPLFDAADPASVVDRRNESTVAPQALFLLNHPFAAEQARAVAAGLMDGPGGTRQRVDRAYRTLLARPASDPEQALARAFLGDTPRRPDWEAFAHMLMCSNEFIYVD